MNSVKGSKEYQWRVVKHHPRLWFWQGLGLFAAFVLSLEAAYWFGQNRRFSSEQQALNELTAAATELESVRQAEHDLRRQLEKAKLGTEVDRRSLEDVRRELLSLKTDLASLEEENQFYRNLMAPAGNQRGLHFGAVELADTDQPRTFRYKVVLQQLATQHELIKGSLTFKIVGRQDGEPKVLALHEVSPAAERADLKLRFKYFQNIEGQLVLPTGFEPERIELEAKSTGKNATTIQKRFGWLVQQAPLAAGA